MEFRVWAPNATRAVVRVGARDHDLVSAGDGVWEAILEAGPGDDYLYVLDGEVWPDPCSRFQPEGIRGPSQVVDPRRFSWTDAAWNGVALDGLVIYELHVGTFSEQGTFDGVIPYLEGLGELGVTAIELMPVATFPGERGWGYDGVYAYAPHPAYGGPDGLARLVDAAHAAGLGVLLDVVYNHIGPGSEAIGAFGPYFTDRHDTFWGDAMNYAEDGVREWAIQNAMHVGARLPRRRPASRRDARDLRRAPAPRPGRARRARARRAASARSSSRRWPPATSARSRRGATTHSGRTSSITTSTSC